MRDVGPMGDEFHWTNRVVRALAAFALLAAAAWVLARYSRTITPTQLIAAFGTTARWRVVVSAALTVTSFSALATYDVISARLVSGRTVPTSIAAFAGATANAISNTLGLHAITASAVRYRIYRRWGLSVQQTARIIALSWAALGLGFLTALALAFLVQPSDSTAGQNPILYRAVGSALVTLVALLLVWMTRAPRTLRFATLSLTLPSGALAPLQVLIGTIETGATIGALYVLIPQDVAPAFAPFAAAFIGSVLLGIASHAPGGIGVFEASMISLFPSGHTEFLAALLLFRLIYNIMPFVLSVAALGVFELAARLIQFDGG